KRDWSSDVCSSDLFKDGFLTLLLDQTTIGTSIKDRIPPASDNISKLEPATTIPDKLPPATPPNAIKTSIVPWVLARISGSVESTIKAVPLIKPKFQPRPSNTRATVMRNNDSPGAAIATMPEASKVIPEAIAIVNRPSLSTRMPVNGEGR